MSGTIRIVLLFSFSLGCGYCGIAPVSEYRLPNGMKILVQERHAIPNAAVYLFFRAGARNERPGVTGISHFLEHMMFNGAGQFDITLEANGGSDNAYTSDDATVFMDIIPSSGLDLVFSLEAGRMAHLKIDPERLESERRVILSERSSTVESDDFELLQERLYRTMYGTHRYGWPILGWPSDLRSITARDLEGYYKDAYAPNNSVIVVVGDVSGEAVLDLAARYFGRIPPQPPLGLAAKSAPRQDSPRRVVMRKPAHTGLELFSYMVPPPSDPAYWALRELTCVLARGRSSRLHQRLVDRDRLALSVSATLRPGVDPGELIFTTEYRRRSDARRISAAVADEIRRIRSEPVSSEELSRAKAQLLTDLARETSTNAGAADWLGTYEMFFGGYRKMFSAPDEIAKVTPQDILRVARLHLRPENLTIATLIPEAERP